MKKRLSIIIVGLLFGLFIFATPSFAYVIDGDLSDWGLNKLKDTSYSWSDEETWLPNSGVSFIVEDNFNPLHTDSSYTYFGVHIKGVGSSYSSYNELKKIKLENGIEVSEPYGGEYYDLEARYFDQDDDYIYIAIVTSLEPTAEGDKRPGDLALNIDLDSSTGDLGYEYGVKIHEDPEQGNIIYNPVWEKLGYLLPVLPDRIVPDSGNKVGIADIAYTNQWLSRQDWGKDNYVIEIAIDKTVIGLSKGDIVSDRSIMYCDNCINEHIFVPEFPTIAVSLAIIIGFMSVIYMGRERIVKK
ncbi:hypothetical protein F1737_06225 [Methanoplanus sp. FWC-SCC4]|uniref:Uncharacterized protein n=1 Tax=Methanochimaera problematica TaxID=2609417 RepID=A0AA97FDQ0_9EURY|nr:hypothetical protein [Methanoplanus sp. FWC-SCC4]WOF16339.1 hypothetical protein F1737_06225 [Methanoplanus sp. FWC-SCC4]